MSDEYTTNYNFFLPKDTDSMADVVKNFTTSFNRIEPINDITVIPAGGALPQSGNYEIGDRVFRDDANTGETYPSNYILICKDADWGWHWRPIQHRISPWVPIPDTAIADLYNGVYTVNSIFPLEIALDNRGGCHWRGTVSKLTADISENIELWVLKNIPLGIRPNINLVHTCAISPPNASVDTGLDGLVTGQFFIDTDGNSYLLGYNTNTVNSQRFWLTGLSYNNARSVYFNA